MADQPVQEDTGGSGGKLNVYNLGSLGVNVDKSPIHLEDGEFTKTQNAILSEVDNALRKRPGLVKFNSVAAAGSILGGIGVPLLDQSSGTAGTRKFYFGINGQWYTSIDDWSNVVITSTPAASVQATNYPSQRFSPSIIWAGRTAIVYSNRMYYADDAFTLGTSAQHIRVWDGVTDRRLATIPYNPDTGATVSFGVTTMLSANNAIYVATLDGGTSDTDWRGRVFQLNPSTGVLTQLGGTITTGEVPYCLAFYLGRLWLGTTHKTRTAQGKVYWIRPGIDSAWTLDNTFAAGLYGVMGLMAYNGELYAGTIANNLTNSLCVKRSTLGVWSTSDTCASSNTDNGYYTLQAYNGNLFAGSSAAGFNIVRKFDGTTWSTVLAPGTGFTNLSLLFVHNNKIYAPVSIYGTGGPNVDLYSSATGNNGTWTSIQTGGGALNHSGAFVALVT